jgi:hypothetical protein
MGRKSKERIKKRKENFTKGTTVRSVTFLTSDIYLGWSQSPKQTSGAASAMLPPYT